MSLPVPALPASALTTSTPWEFVVEAYLDAAIDSAHTRRAYERHLRDAFAVLRAATVSELNGTDLARYRAAVVSSDLAPGSQAQALAALRSFLSWSRTLGAHGLSGDVIRTALKTPKAVVRRPYRTLGESDIAAVLATASTARDRALLAVLLGAGLRAAEAVGLDVTDLHDDPEGGLVIAVRRGKGRRDRQVPVQPDVSRLLFAYLAETGRRLGDSGPLFRAHDRGAARRERARLSTRAIDYLVRQAMERAGLVAKAISPHSLRHTYAIRALRAGGNVIAVQKLLGHASVATTQRYLDHLALGELRAVVPPLPTRVSRRVTGEGSDVRSLGLEQSWW
jgi:site-specific recombinase XerD